MTNDKTHHQNIIIAKLYTYFACHQSEVWIQNSQEKLKLIDEYKNNLGYVQYVIINPFNKYDTFKISNIFHSTPVRNTASTSTWERAPVPLGQAVSINMV